MVRERRRTYRIRSAGCEPAILKTDSGQWSGRLLDHSAGGFGVQFPGQPPVSAGAEGQLAALHSLFHVRVARVEPRGGMTYVGMERVGDLPLPEDLAPARPTWRSYFPPIPRAVVRGMTWCGIGITALLVFAIWTGRLLISHAPFSLPEIQTAGVGRSSVSASSPSRAAQPSSKSTNKPAVPVARGPMTSATRAATSTSSATGSEVPTVLGFQASLPPQFSKLITAKAQLLEFITLPEVAESLALTEEQQNAIVQQVSRLREILSEQFRHSAQWDDRTIAALQDAHQAVLNTLDGEQRRRIELMIDRASR